MNPAPHRYLMLNKPHGMVSQFVSSHAVPLLGDLGFCFPEGIHAVGRLDRDSEGLLLLTTNKKITNLLFSGGEPHTRRYLVQVNNSISPEQLLALQTGVDIRVEGDQLYTTPPCQVEIVNDPSILYHAPPPVVRYQPGDWLLISLKEGRFRQVRKMVNAVHHRCWRLVRVSIEDLFLGDLAPGAVRELPERDFFGKLGLKTPPEN